MDYFKSSGKPLVAFLEGGGEKEYLVALGCDEVRLAVVVVVVVVVVGDGGEGRRRE